MQKLIIMLAAGAFAIGAQAAGKVTLDWKVGDADPNGNRLNHLRLVNNTTDTIRAPWTLYFGSYPIYTSRTPGYDAVQVSGTHHSIVAADKSASIPPGAETDIDLAGWYVHQKSFFPENPYIVGTSAKGLQETPIRVRLDYTEADHREMASKIADYPDGERVYARNELLKAAGMPGVYDIIPGIKSVSLTRGAKLLKMDGVVTLEGDKSFAGEMQVFAEMLRRQGVDVGKGGTRVTLVRKNGYAPEAYGMTIAKDGIRIMASSPAGAQNGAMTLLAVLAGHRFPLELPVAEINDAPSLGYRGVHFDVARNFTGKDNVMRILDLMALYKLNKLHFHLVDDEGWRLAIDGLEELTEVGSRRLQNDYDIAQYPYYGSGADGNTTGNGYYTRQDFIDILKYAADRHIEVIPEIDMPGHSRAAINAMKYRYNRYKDTDLERAAEYLLCDFNDASVYRGAQEYNDNVMCIALPSALNFSKKVIDELAGMYSEAGLRLGTVHVGGDEVPDGAWLGSPLCRAYMKEHGLKDTRALRDDFLRKIYDYVSPKGIRIAGWQEILTEADGKTPSKTLPGHDMLSYMWNTQTYNDMDQTSYALINAGFPVVLCNVNNLYMDLAYNRNVMEPGLTWGGTVDEYSTFGVLPYDLYNSLRRIENPSDWDKDHSEGKIALDPSARHNIRGIQGQLWAECYRNFDMVQERMLPKALGLAERAWNPEPAWAGKGYDAYRKAAAQYTARTGANEFSRLARLGYNYHVGAPGLKVENGCLLANTPYPEAEIHYTLDGSQPTEASPLWTVPVDIGNAKTVRAIAVLNGRKSCVTELFR